MLKAEIQNLLDKIERELLQFTAFLKNVEEKCNEVMQNSGNNSKEKQKKTSKVTSIDDEGDIIDGASLIDAFNIVKNVLLRISTLIDKFILVLADDEPKLKGNEAFSVRSYYTKYVYQIASQLLKVVEEHLGHFAKRLDHLSAPETEKTKGSSVTSQKRDVPNYSSVRQSRQEAPSHQGEYFYGHSSQKREVPTYSNVRQPKREKLSFEDEPAYERPQARNYKCRLKATQRPTCSYSRSSSEESGSSSGRDKGTRERHETLVHLGNVAKGLVAVIEEIVTRIKCPKQKDLVQEDEKQRCCTETCEKCCEYCRHQHRSSNIKAYEEDWRFWDENMFPEPFWLKVNPVSNRPKSDSTNWKSKNHDNYSKNFAQARGSSQSETGDLTQDMRNVEYYSADKDFQTSDTHSPSEKHHNRKQKLNDNVEKIQPNKPTRRLSKGDLSRKHVHSPRRPARFTRKSQGILYNRIYDLPPGLSSIVEEGLFGKREPKKKKNTPSPDSGSSAEESDSEDDAPDEQRIRKRFEKEGKVSKSNDDTKMIFPDLKEMLFHEENTDDKPCLLPETEGNCTENEILGNKSFGEESKYPHFFVFNVHMFSNMLKDQFKKYFSRSPGATDDSEILNILFECMEESIHYRGMEDTFEDQHTVAKRVEEENSVKGTMTEDELNYKCGKTLHDVVNEMIQVTAEIMGSEENGVLKPVNDLEKLLPTDSPTRQNFEALIAKISTLLCKKDKISQACETCKQLIVEQEDKKNGKKCLKGYCFRCWNARSRGLSIHRCHYSLPPGILEVRHMDDKDQICVCYLRWDEEQEVEDWRWMGSPFNDPTRVEFLQEATNETDTILRVFYGRHGNMVKESLAETQLGTVEVNLPKSKSSDERRIQKTKGRGFASESSIYILKNANADLRSEGKRRRQTSCSILSRDKTLVTKLGRLFEDLQTIGFAAGPPLILTLRKKRVLNDALDLLMAPSQIRLGYYRSLRVIFLSKKSMCIEPTTTNFIEEDESEELFYLFSRKLFNPSDMRVFEYPSEETQFLHLNPEEKTHSQWFEFAGVVLALAILHHKKLEVNLALCLFKCLLDRPLYIEDLKEIDPLLYQRLKWMMTHNLDDKRHFFCSFTVKDRIGDRVLERDLVPNGSEILVTEKNKNTYFDLTLKWKLAERYLPQLKDFRRGFSSVIEPCHLSMFSVKELQNLIKEPPDSKIFLSESHLMNRIVSRRGTA